MMRGRGRPEELAFVAIAALAGCAGQAPGEAAYAAGQCRRVALIDQASGDTIKGAEDLALDADSGRLFIAAYDRRAAEKAARRGAASIPEGGLYAVSLAEALGGERAYAAPIAPSGDFTGGLRPHGVSYDPGTEEIAFVNRAYLKTDGRWRMTARIERVGVNGEVIVSEEGRTPCAANDLVSDGGGELLISFNYEHCDWRAGIENAFSLRRSGIARLDGERLFDKALFANGVVRLGEGRFALAATREKSLLLIGESPSGLEVEKRIKLPGGPDNLTLTADGALIAAVHPSMLQIALHRRLGFPAAPSRVVRVDPASAAVTLLFDDPSGERFSAATVAAEWEGALILGSVTDEGLLVCEEER